MSVEEYSTGLPQNHTKRFDALTYKTAHAYEEWDSDFTDDNCIVVYYQPHTPMMDTGTIPKGELSGFYALKTFWTSDNLGQLDIEVLIYKDNVLENTLTTFSGGDYLTSGSIYTVFFSPLSEYQIIVQTGSQAGSSKVKLDYIQLDSIPRNMVASAVEYSSSSDGTPYLEVVDRGTITQTYSGGSGATTAVTFNVTYATPPQVYTQMGDHNLVAAPESVTTTGCNVVSRTVDGTGYGGGVLVYWKAEGSVAAPFKSLGNVI